MAEIRHNSLHFEDGIDGMTFEITEYAITSGQPWEGISSISCDSGKCTMHVQAGRKGSKSVADWFKEKVAGGAAAAWTSDQWPDELNFAFIGTLTFEHSGNTYEGHNIVIAQGHSSFLNANNWWLGGYDMSYAPSETRYEAVTQNFVRNNSAGVDVTFFQAGTEVFSVTTK